MAIHEDVPGIEVTVRCHKQPLRELEDPSAHDDDASVCPTTSKYVECMDDTEFDISIRVGTNYNWGYRDHVLVPSIYIDGKYVTARVVRSRDIYVTLNKSLSVTGTDTQNSASGLWTRSKFKFSAVKTSECASCLLFWDVQLFTIHIYS